MELLTTLAYIVDADEVKSDRVKSIVQRWVTSEDHAFHRLFARTMSGFLCDEVFGVYSGNTVLPALALFHYSLFGTVYNDTFTLDDPIDRERIDTALYPSFMIFCLRQMCSRNPANARNTMGFPMRSLWYGRFLAACNNC